MSAELPYLEIENFTVTATAADAGLRLDVFLAKHLPKLSRSDIQRLVKDAHARMDQAPAKCSYRMRVADVVELHVPKPVATKTEAEDIPLAILFEDSHLAVLNKPAGMVVHPAAGHHSGTLVNALLHHCKDLSGIGGEERPGIVHRLDKETSGCLVIAKHDIAHRNLKTQFESRDVQKVYLTLAFGRFRSKTFRINEPIARDPHHRQRMAVVQDGKPARTDFRVLGEYPWGSLVECTLHTGRTHQIRVHLKHCGHPVLGDAVYGRRSTYPRQMLHAWKLGFSHPITGVRMSFLSPLPEDFRSLDVQEPE